MGGPVQDRCRDLAAADPEGIEMQPFVLEVETVAPRAAHEHDLSGVGPFDGAAKQVLVERQRVVPSVPDGQTILGQLDPRAQEPVLIGRCQS